MSQDYLKVMKDFARDAGKIAMDLMGKSDPSLKVDKSVITLADKSISRLAHERLGEILAQPGHILVDEEDSRHADYLDQEFLDKTEYIWAVDPIDGTRIYANHMPHFGISIGLVKDLKPYLGVVYFPALHELFYCDGDKAYFVRNAFSDQAIETVIELIDQEIVSQSVFFCHDSFFKQFDWDNTDCRAMILACAVVDMCWPAVGRGCGGIFQPALWDFAGSWPIAQKAGLELWALATGEKLERVHVDFFKKVNSPWELKELHIVSSKRNFPILQTKMTPLKNLKGSS